MRRLSFPQHVQKDFNRLRMFRKSCVKNLSTTNNPYSTRNAKCLIDVLSVHHLLTELSSLHCSNNADLCSHLHYRIPRPSHKRGKSCASYHTSMVHIILVESDAPQDGDDRFPVQYPLDFHCNTDELAYTFVRHSHTISAAFMQTN